MSGKRLNHHFNQMEKLFLNGSRINLMEHGKRLRIRLMSKKLMSSSKMCGKISSHLSAVLPIGLKISSQPLGRK